MAKVLSQLSSFLRAWPFPPHNLSWQLLKLEEKCTVHDVNWHTWWGWWGRCPAWGVPSPGTTARTLSDTPYPSSHPFLDTSLAILQNSEHAGYLYKTNLTIFYCSIKLRKPRRANETSGPWNLVTIRSIYRFGPLHYQRKGKQSVRIVQAQVGTWARIFRHQK